MKNNLYLFLAIVAVMLAYLMRKPHTQPTTTQNQASAPIPQSQSSEAASQQAFDYYLLNLSWSPEFCHSHPDAPECASHSTFVLHGLWPQNTDGSYPQNCGTAPGPSNPRQYADIYPDAGLLQHEWKTHGTCSGLAPDTFFHLARQAIHSVTIPTQLASISQQLSLPPDDIRSLFTQANPSIPAASLAISCGNNYLTAVEVCFNKSLQPIDCGPIRTCRANTVRIPPPQ